MKKVILVVSMFVLVVGTLFIFGCKKSDTTAPVITLTGQNPVNVTLGTAYSDGGATAKDDVDGDITSKIVVTYTPSQPTSTSPAGAYVVHYNVSDAAGNAATEITRTVNVVNAVANMAGTYSESEVCSVSGSNSGSATIAASSTVNNRISISNFALNATATINADISGLNVTIATQQSGSDWYYGNGSISGTTMYINYTDSTATGVQTCTTTYVKQ